MGGRAQLPSAALPFFYSPFDLPSSNAAQRTIQRKKGVWKSGDGGGVKEGMTVDLQTKVTG
jgi:hypothetical protein